ncbi:MAG: hypothetical protein HRU01_11620 [Myxococcales bacterium]|nr:hypothetical protein [Myxococcales bacterium]
MIQSCALAYTSDDLPTEAASASHPRALSFADAPGAYGETFIGTSLDHAIWLHRRGRHDDWMLHDFQSPDRAVCASWAFALGYPGNSRRSGGSIRPEVSCSKATWSQILVQQISRAIRCA